MDWALHRVDIGRGFSGLVMEEIDRVTGMMPKQVIRPASRLSCGIHIRATEEEGLNDEMLELEFTRFDPFVNPLMAWIEAPRVTTHRGDAGFFLHGENF